MATPSREGGRSLPLSDRALPGRRACLRTGAGAGLAALCSGLLTPEPASAVFPGEVRLWTLPNGNPIEAMAVYFDGQFAFLRIANGQVMSFPANTLSAEDQGYLKQWGQYRLDLRNVRWPNQTSLSSRVSVTGGPMLFETPHFQFAGDSRLPTALVQHYAKVFEGTYEAIRQLPLGLLNEGDTRKRIVKVFGTYRNYVAAGGSPGSLGVYMIRTSEVLVPAEAIGAKKTASGAIRRDASRGDTGTLIHEITHQTMRDWVLMLPIWFVEGFAEYMLATPYSEGRFNFSNTNLGIKTALRDAYATDGGRGVSRYPVVHPRSLLNMSNSQWNTAVGNGHGRALYTSSMLFTWYFCNLNGRDALPLLGFLQSSRAAATNSTPAGGGGKALDPNKVLLGDRTYDQLWTAMQRAFSSQRITVEVVEGSDESNPGR